MTNPPRRPTEAERKALRTISFHNTKTRNSGTVTGLVIRGDRANDNREGVALLMYSAGYLWDEYIIGPTDAIDSMQPVLTIQAGDTYSQWIAECCDTLGWPRERGGELVGSGSWLAAYDDGLTPAEAVAGYQAQAALPGRV